MVKYSAKRKSSSAHLKSAILRAINRIYEKSMSCDTAEQLGRACLSIVEDATGSKLSFVGEVENEGFFREIAIGERGLKQYLAMDKTVLYAQRPVAGLCKCVLGGATLLTNDPPADPHGTGLPAGHPVFSSFLGVPFRQKGRIYGMIGVANKDGGYTDGDREMLEALTPAVLEVLMRKRAELAALESEQKYQQLVKNAAVGIYEVSFQSKRFVFVNDVICRTLGYSREELLTMTPFDVVDEPGKAVLQKRISQWLSGALPDQEVDYTIFAKDGREIVVLLNVSLFFNEQGSPQGFIAVAHDITERRRAEDALRESEQKYQELVDYAAVIMCEVDFRSRRFLHVNDVMCRLTGYSREELLAIDPFSLVDKQNKELLCSWMCQWLNGIAPDHDVEYTMKTRDGHDISLHLTVRFTRDDNGLPKGAISIGQDITGLKRRERNAALIGKTEDIFSRVTDPVELTDALGIKLKEHLRVSRLTFLEIDESADTMTALYDNRDPGLPAIMEPLRVSDYIGEDTLRGQKAGSIIVADDIVSDARFAGRAAAYAEGLVRSQMAAPFLRDGKPYFLIVAQCSEPRHWLSDEIDLLRELTARIYPQIVRVRAEAALRESEARAIALARELEKKNQFITDFFINISHEFKTPLTILMLGLELLEKKMGGRHGAGNGVDKNIAVMKQNAYRLSRLVSNLLDITKLDAGFMQPAWEKRNIVEWIGRLVRSTEFYAGQKGISLTYVSDTGEMEMLTDGFMLDRIMLNLLSNAIKHTPRGGCIVVSCCICPSCVRVAVQDNGEGIPEDRKGIIFDRFSQVNTKLTRDSEGSGIGLALTKSLVELLGGEIRFKSTLGAGSEFTFELPVLHMEREDRAAVSGGMQLDKRVQMEFSGIGMDVT